MECPHCHKSGNALQRIFDRPDKDGVRRCIFCGARIKIVYNWKRIFIMAIIVTVVIACIHLVMQRFFDMPGLTSGMAGSMVAIIVFFIMRNPPYTNVIEITGNKKNAKK